MVCYLKFLKYVQELAGVTEKEAEDILRDIEADVGHNAELIKAVLDAERQDLARRLSKKKSKEKSIAYA